jgi:hypothetical protein
MPDFCRYIGIDYSGAETPKASLKGLRVYLAQDDTPATEVLPAPSPRKYWTRKGIAEWLLVRLAEDIATIVGIDHGFSFPIRYFEAHHLIPDWDSFLEDFQQYWPTDGDYIYVDFIRDGLAGNGLGRDGSSRWRRVCETRCRAKSVFHFDVQGAVAKSTHAGIPWLLFLRRQCPDVHFWPFDGWLPPNGCSVVCEAYPSLWRHAYPTEERTPDQHDAYTIATGLQQADRGGTLASMMSPRFQGQERAVAGVEGWIIGVD